MSYKVLTVENKRFYTVPLSDWLA